MKRLASAAESCAEEECLPAAAGSKEELEVKLDFSYRSFEWSDHGPSRFGGRAAAGL